jgi:hypothetical protein
MAATLETGLTYPAVPLGSIVQPWGEVGAVGCITGERYYWMVSWRGVSMIPAYVVEEQWQAQCSVS